MAPPPPPSVAFDDDNDDDATSAGATGAIGAIGAGGGGGGEIPKAKVGLGRRMRTNSVVGSVAINDAGGAESAEGSDAAAAAVAKGSR